MNIILYGYQGAGKTHFGSLLAKKLNLNFIDTDSLVASLYETATGKKISVREIFQSVGESSFRGMEQEAVHSLQNVTHSVIAAGGGIVLSRHNIDALQKLGPLVFLDVEKEILLKRMQEKEIPAFVDPMNPEESFARIYEHRRTLYESIPCSKVVIDGQKKDEDVLSLLEEIFKNQKHEK